MPKSADKFELTLSLPEVVVLFVVMVALFTGLLFFGYRVGNAHNNNAVELPSTPVAPAQESPGRQRQTPVGGEIEPEYRLENASPEKPGDLRQAPVRLDRRDETGPRRLTQRDEDSPHPCKADTYWSFLRKAVPTKHRFFERLADWAGVPPLDTVRQTTQEPRRDSEAQLVADSIFFLNSSHDSEASECGAPIPRTGERSVAC